MLSVVVKATFSLGADGEAPLADEQEPLRCDQPDPEGDADELRYASDFAPQKARADVLLVGHAHARTRVTTIDAGFTVDVLHKRFLARAAAPSTRIPLVARRLRGDDRPDAPPVAVGPRAPWSRQRAAYGGQDYIGPHGAPMLPLGNDFDFQFFNTAPPDQQLGVLRANGTLTLEGLLPGAQRRHVWLPGHRPRAFLLAEGGSRERAPEVQLSCDTLWIDVDRAVCVLVWRGVIAHSRSARPTASLVLSLEARGAVQSWTTLRDALPSARVSEAVEAADALLPSASRLAPADVGGASCAGITPIDLALMETAVTEVKPEPVTRQLVGRDAPTLPRPLPSLVPLLQHDALPISSNRPSREEPTLVRGPKEGETVAGPPSSGDAPTHVESEPPARVSASLDEARRARPAFESASELSSVTTLRNPPLASRADEDATVPVVLVAPDAPLSLELYAEIQVELSHRPGALISLLGERGVALDVFRGSERHYSAALAAEAGRGQAELSDRFDEALERARRLLAEREAPK